MLDGQEVSVPRVGTLAELYAPPGDRPSAYARRLNWENDEDRLTYIAMREAALQQVEKATGKRGGLPSEEAQRKMLTLHEDGSGYWGLFLRFPHQGVEFCICSVALTRHAHRQTWGYDSDYWADHLVDEFGIEGSELEEALDSTMYLNQLVGGASRAAAWKKFVKTHKLKLPKGFAIPDIYEHVRRERSAKYFAGEPDDWWVERDRSQERMVSDETELPAEHLFARLKPRAKLYRKSNYDLYFEQSRYRFTSMPTRYLMDFLSSLSMTVFDRALVRLDIKADNGSLQRYYTKAFRALHVGDRGVNYPAHLVEMLACAWRTPTVYCEESLFTQGYDPYQQLDRYGYYFNVSEGMEWLDTPTFPSVTRTQYVLDSEGAQIPVLRDLDNGATTYVFGTPEVPEPHTDVREFKPSPLVEPGALRMPRYSAPWEVLRGEMMARTEIPDNGRRRRA